MAEAPRSDSDIPRTVTLLLQTEPGARRGALAWLVSPMAALTRSSLVERLANSVPQTSRPPRLTLSTFDGAWTSPGSIQQTDPELGVALIALERPLEVPDPGILRAHAPESGEEWEAATADGRVVRGKVIGALREEGNLQFGDWLRMKHLDDADDESLAGAPFVTADGVAGLLVSSVGGRETGCFGIPVSTLAASPVGQAVRARLGDQRPVEAPEEQATAVRSLEGDPLFQNLAPSALTALNHAEGIRLRLERDRLHMEFLIGGLAADPAGALAGLMARARVDQARLLETVASTAKTRLPVPGDYPVSSLTSAPSPSGHVRAAVVMARKIADATHDGVMEDRHLLYGVLSVAECEAVVALNRLGLRKEDLSLRFPSRREIAALRPDTAEGDDRLGLEREVNALAAVLAARDVQPPLSVGLFGDWGSGKSFFMKELEKAINAYSESARTSPKGSGTGPASPYCERVVQLWFNAWHYMDTDLWASLASEIFEQLAAFLDKQVDEAGRAAGVLPPREQLLAAAVNTRDVLAQAERVRDAAQRELEASEKRLQSVTGSEAEIEASLGPKAILRAALKSAVAQPVVNDKIKAATRELGLTTAASAATDLKAQVLELKGAVGYVRGLILALRYGGSRAWILTLLLVIGLAVVVPVVHQWARRVNLPDMISAVTAAVVTLGAALTPVLRRIRKAMDVADAVRRDHRALIETERKKRADAAAATRSQLQADVESAQQRVEEARTELTRIEQRLEMLRADRQVGEFIRERFLSADYSKNFGTIARARNDFERLTLLFAKVRQEAAENADRKRPTLPRIDRIVLYIDDLDRCPEDKVVAVLQAVHLLLAMPLFVVVVGVDSRWLVHSLRHETGIFKQDEDEGAEDRAQMPEEERVHWQSTPLNYLEKIFQIPFTLRPMELGGFSNLIDDLVRQPPETDRHRGPAAPVPGGAGAAAGQPGQPAPAAAPASPAQVAGAAGRQAPPTPAAPGGPSSGPAGAPRLLGAPAAQILRIEEWESRVMKHLFPLIPSPRAAKRFVNVYRLLRATIPEDEYDDFARPEGGDYEVVLLLLGMLTGHPGPTTEILRDLIAGHPEGDWWAFMEQYDSRGDQARLTKEATFEERVESGRWAELWKDLSAIRGQFSSVGPAARFARRAPIVARFSFQSGRVLLDKGIEASTLGRTSGTFGPRRSGETAAPPGPQKN